MFRPKPEPKPLESVLDEFLKTAQEQKSLIEEVMAQNRALLEQFGPVWQITQVLAQELAHQETALATLQNKPRAVVLLRVQHLLERVAQPFLPPEAYQKLLEVALRRAEQDLAEGGSLAPEPLQN